MSLPIITVCGNLKGIELKYTSSGKAVCKFKVECAEKNTKGEWVNLYLSGEMWEKQAEFLNQYFSDGSPAIVTGKLYTNVYEKQDGSKVYENKLLFPSVSFAPKDKSDKQGQQPQHKQETIYEYQDNSGRRTPSPSSSIPEIDIDMETIPF